MTKSSDEAAEVQRVLKAINESWLGGHPESVGPFFHEDVVVVLPGFSGRIHGRDAVVKSFVDFCSNATVQDFLEKDCEVDVIGSTAIATYTFQMSYAMGGK